MMIKYKLREVATDLGVKNKDVIDVLSKYVGGEPKKQTSVLTEEELNIVFDYFTQKNNLDSLDSYYASNTKTNEQDSKSNTDEKPVKKNNQDKPKQADKKPQPKADNNQKKDRKPANDKKPQPKAEVKENNNQSDNNDVQFKNRKERKIVDTRQVVVDVERYNEKYDRLASEKIRSENQTAHKQKIKIGRAHV